MSVCEKHPWANDPSEVERMLQDCIGELYRNDAVLFSGNASKGLCERCLVFRFAYYLQNKFNLYTVDCDYNSHLDAKGKPIYNPEDDVPHGRFVDIIIHKRGTDDGNLLCLEVKKWNNRKDWKKDINNLKVLLNGDYKYRYAFHVILGKDKESTILSPIEA